MLSVELPFGSWSVGSLAAGVFRTPSDVENVETWSTALVPGTVASALLRDVTIRGDSSLEDFDEGDWIFRTTFDAPSDSDSRLRLELEGLATVCEVWVNEARVLVSTNMFRRQAVELPPLRTVGNELLLVFRALGPILAQKRPRPRWKTRLVDAQNLRFIRTTLLGRMVSWTPKLKAVGPWRPVRLRQLSLGGLEHLRHHTVVDGARGRAVFVGSIWAPNVHPIVEVTVGGVRYPVATTRSDARLDFEVTVHVESPPLWWPHTHGEQGGLEYVLTVDGSPQHTGTLRFRRVELDRTDGKVEFVVNEVPTFVRGACWTISDLKSLQNDPTRLRHLLETAQQLGLNMLRVGGTMAYEDDAFYSLCDELGIMVWQEFMFANMDYPFGEESFCQEVTAEVTDVLHRLARFGCIVAYCGGSEVEQQAAMVGLPKADWSNEFVSEVLPRLCTELHPQTAYFPSSPCGGALPFQPSEGIAHYYGVGAYQRDLSDLAVAQVKFASECLAFSNIPDARSLEAFFGVAHPAPHLATWKAGVHRDNGAGWDFEDVRDHYLKTLFGVDPVALRYSDLERYFALSSIVSGEVMARVFSVWRNPTNACAGGLVWFFNDFVPGAGWGLIDSLGAMKPAAFVLKQTLQPVQVLLEDRGLGGHVVTLLNETSSPCDGKLVVQLWQHGRVCTASAEHDVNVAARSGTTLSVDALLGHFHDTTWSYRFGPRKHEAVTARWLGADGRLLAQAVCFVGGGFGALVERCEIQTAFVEDGGANFLEVKSDALLHYARIDIRDCLAVDNFVHLIPGQSYRLRFVKPVGQTRLRGDLTALNYADSVRIAST